MPASAEIVVRLADSDEVIDRLEYAADVIGTLGDALAAATVILQEVRSDHRSPAMLRSRADSWLVANQRLREGI